MKEKELESLSKEIIQVVGGLNNIGNYYNCITRLRLVLNDYSNLDLEKIKQLKNVNGVVLSGKELQIVIGPNVTKVKLFMDKLSKKETKIKVSFIVKLKTGLSEILIPIIPVFLVCGMLKSIEGTLLYFNLIQKVDIQNLNNNDIFSTFVFIISNSGIVYVGLFCSITAAKYYKISEVFALFLGLTILCPFFLNFQGITIISIKGFDYKLFSYTSLILPFIFSIYILSKIDNFFKKFMISYLDPFLRPFFSFLIVVGIHFFISGPILSYLENGVYFLIEIIGKFKYGIASMFFGFIFMILVRYGMHIVFVIPFNIVLNQNIMSFLGPAQWIACYSQLGVTIGILLITKNKELKKACKSSILPGAIFSVIEPSLYGVNTKIKKAFWIGCAVSACISWLSGFLEIKQNVPVGAGGLFSLLGTIESGYIDVCILLALYLTAVLIPIMLIQVFFRKLDFSRFTK
ncbi:hypothetical protein SHELI_v1c09630 [Spiroplasma helicoides]|uniref:Uncharacterized protein n=1 Tax=Spiroplasma helicoides TaxID=216938 RepID=A0A1B3SLV3_9MOLU|nr:PTS transporter subunit EIIC [Spiroplasma helicoides]AOG60912.1 hypothetical protein SHELI_v1c09630 [Spiroplasma helicoides]